MEIDVTYRQYSELRTSLTSRPIAGLIAFRGAGGAGGGLQRAGWLKMMQRLMDRGLVEPYPHGGFEITAAGIDVRDRPWQRPKRRTHVEIS